MIEEYHLLPLQEREKTLGFVVFSHESFIMPGFDPGIFFGGHQKDRRVWPGDDDGEGRVAVLDRGIFVPAHSWRMKRTAA